MTFGRRLRLAFATRRGLAGLVAQALIAFGLVAAAVQLAGQVFAIKFREPVALTLVVVGCCLLWGLVRTIPGRRVHREFGRPNMTVTVQAGDLFDEAGHIVAGFTDTFDTDTTDDLVINRRSVQGQVLHRRYGGDVGKLDAELDAALAATAVAGEESRSRKPIGKLSRYPIGTVATIGPPDCRVFAVAYSRMGTDLVARSGVEDLWHSLARLWDAVFRHAQRGRIAMPLVGADLARIDWLDRESLLRMVLLSFVARSRQELVCRELVIVLQPKDFERLNLLELEAFLRAL
jgi:hypothetical protein